MSSIPDPAPDRARAHFSAGVLHCERAAWREAIECFRAALSLRPDHAEAHCNLGTALQECGALDDAVRCFRTAIGLRPDYYEAHYNLGNALKERGDLDAAADEYRAALRLQPDFPPAHNNLGTVLQQRGELDGAERAFAAALRLDPGFEKAHNGLGLVRFERGHVGEAIERYRHALRLAPDFAEAHLNLALALLLSGRLQEGWGEYEWRWRSRALGLERRHRDAPRWRGEPLAGRSILLHYEQGLGDTIQFARLAHAVAALGARVMLEVQAPLHALLRRALAPLEVLRAGDPLPTFDYQCPLLSVPGALGITLDDVPAAVPYLAADEALRLRWRERIGGAQGLRVGIAWAGSATHRYDRNRSVPFALLAPLLGVPGVRGYSLQKGAAARAAGKTRGGDALIDWTDELASFDDTAALVACLDLVVTVDTAVAHLAGALGKPVWLLTPFAPDWRWLLERADSPWYPTMRLFRQRAPRDWGGVVGDVRAELARLCADRAAAPQRAAREAERRRSVVARRETDRARWSDERQLDPAWERRAALAADHVAAGSKVLDLGCGAMTLERHLPFGCTYLPVDLVARDERTRVCDFNRDGLPSADGATVVVALGVLEYVYDVGAFLAGIRAFGLPVVLSYCCADLGPQVDRAALGWVNHLTRRGLAEALAAADLHVRAESRIDEMQVLLRLAPRAPRAERSPRVVVLTFNNVGNFGDRLGYHLVNEILPAHATVTHAHFRPWDVPDEPFDLLVLGAGNSLFAPLLTDRLGALLARAPAAVGVFGTQYRAELDARRLGGILDRLAAWYARSEEDLLLFAGARGNAVHLGDWLVSAFPMARGRDERVLNVGDEIWQDLPLDRTIQRIQAHRQVRSARLHPLLGALASAERVAYVEQRETPTRAPSGKFRSMLIDVFGRTYPEDEFFAVDRDAVARYKRQVQSAMGGMRAALASLVGAPPASPR